jgi:hypothetical protein
MLTNTSHRQANSSDMLEKQSKNLESLMQSGTSTEMAILDAISRSSKQLNAAVTDLADRLTLQSDREKLAAIQTWQASNQMGLSEFVGGLNNQIHQRRLKQAATLVLNVLQFDQLHDRYEKIPEAHAKTYRWIFSDPSPDSGFSSFEKWLEQTGRSQSIYWITGKPGSGKSTLMRYICETVETTRYLKSWQGKDNLFLARAFFWNPGTAIQKSLTGLLRSLLHQLLSRAPGMIEVIAPTRWQRSELSTEYNLITTEWKEQWGDDEMVTALRHFVRNAQGSIKIIFLIDGLDEFDGNDSQRLAVVNLLKDISGSGAAKVCASSRPWLVFQDEFESSPQLKLEELSRHDIRMYVADLLTNSKRFCVMQNRFPEECNALMLEICEKAQGVFLWVCLVVQTILEDVRDGNSLSELRSTLYSFPSDLEEYFKRLFTTLDNKYRPEAARLFRLALYTSHESRSQNPLTLMTTSFVNEKCLDFAMRVEPIPTPNTELEEKLETARRRLNSRCKGLLEVSNLCVRDRGIFLASRVDFLHRTVKDFLLTKEMTDILDAYFTSGDDEGLFLIHAILAQIKMTTLQDGRYSKGSGTKDFFVLVEQILFQIRELEARTDADSTMLVNELGRTLWILSTSLGQCFDTTPPGTPEWWHHWKLWDNPVLRLSIHSGLSKYAIKHISPRAIKHHNGRPLLDCALRRDWLAPDSHHRPAPKLVKALLDAGASPTETFQGCSVWAHFIGDIHALGSSQARGNSVEEHVYADWLSCTELLVDTGVCEIGNNLPNRGRATSYPNTVPVGEILHGFFSPEDATRLKKALERTDTQVRRYVITMIIIVIFVFFKILYESQVT